MKAAISALIAFSPKFRKNQFVLVALPLRQRPDFETSRALCGLAQNSVHCVRNRVRSATG
ncbi:hypothetical protein [Lapidilactobacillus salsurivasis]